MFLQALDHHQFGRLNCAEALYRRILQIEQFHSDANHNLGVIAMKFGQHADAMHLFKMALSTSPAHAIYQQSYAIAWLASTTHRLPLLLAQRAYADLESCALEIISKQSDCGVAWKFLGISLMLQHKSALHALQKAAVYLPQDSGIWSNLVAAHHQLGQFVEAEANGRRALSINPDFLEAHLNLGMTFHATGRFADSNSSYERALALNPMLPQALVALSIGYKNIGAFDQCVDAAQRFIQLVLAGKLDSAQGGFHPVLVHTAINTALPMVVSAAHATLTALRERLGNAGIDWCLYGGSALGVYREGDFLAHDKDIDIAMPASVNRKQLLDVMTCDGCFETIHHFGMNKANDNVYNIAFVHLAQNIGVDFFFMHPDGEDHFIAGFNHPGQAVLCRIRKFAFSDYPWRSGGHSHCPMPSTIEAYLEDVYGLNWRSPDKFFDTVLSNPQRLAESIPVAICYGYCRLINKLSEKNRAASLAYCQQITVRTSDPLIAQLQCALHSDGFVL